MNNRAKILVVEADRAILNATRRTLEAAGYETLGAHDGEQALQAACEHRPDLVLLDVNMPGMDGFEVCRRIKSDPSLSGLFVIILSSTHSDGANQVQGMDTGADDYITRPIANHELLARLQAMLRIQKAEKALALNEQRFQALNERLPLGYQSLDADGKFIEVNQVWLDVLGYDCGEVIGRWFGDFLAPHQKKLFKSRFLKFKQAGEVHNVEFEMVRKNGAHINVSFDGRIGYDEQMQFKQTHCLINDITERKRAEETIRLSEARYRSLVETQTDIIARSDLSGNLSFVNDSYCRTFGLRREQALGRNFASTVVPDDLPMVLQTMETIQQPPYRRYIEIRNVTAGGIRWFGWDSSAVLDEQGNIIEFQGVGRNITARKQAEEAQRAIERQYYQLIEQAADGIFILAPDGKFTLANSKTCEMLGYTQEELLQINIFDTYPAELIDAHKQRKLTIRDVPQSRFERPMRRKDGSVFMVEASVVALADGSLQAIVRDITQRKQTEETLQRTKDYWQSLVENTSDLVSILDADGVVLYQNPAIERILGYKPEEIIGKNAVDFVHPEDLSRGWDIFTASANTPGLTPPVVELRVRNKDGSWHILETTGEVRTNETGRGVGVLTSRDVTERKRAEETLKANEQSAHQIAKQLQVVHQIAVKLSTDLDFERLMQTLYEQCQQIGEVDTFYVALCEAATERLSFPFNYKDGERRVFEARNLKENPGLVGKIIEQRQTLYLPDTSELPPDVHLIRQPGIPTRSFLGVPLMLNQRVVGVLSIQSYQPNAYSQEQIQTLELLATQVAIAIQNSRLYEQAQIEIAERKQVEEELRASEEKFRGVMEQSSDGIVITDEQGMVIEWNRKQEEIMGFVKQEVLGRPIWEAQYVVAVPEKQNPQVYQRLKEFILQILKGRRSEAFGKIIENKICRKDGQIRNIESVIYPIRVGAHFLIGSITRDITERKQAEETLQRTKDYWQSLVENTSDLVTVLDADSVILYENPAVERILGYTPGENIGKNAAEFIHPEDWSHAWDVFAASVRTPGLKPPLVELRLCRKDGSWQIMETSGDVRTNETGQLIAVLTSRDITERKLAENALRSSEIRYRKLHESMMDGFSYVDMQGRIRDCNASYQQMVGYSLEELSCFTYVDLTPQKWHAYEQKIVEEQILTRGYSEIYEKEYRKKDGTLFPVELRSVLIRNDAGENEGIWAIVRDITERKRAEVDMRESRARYQSLFENSPISLWEEDYSGVKEYFDELRASGVKDFRDYFDSTPEAIQACAGLIKVLDVNQATLDLMGIRDKSALLGTLAKSLDREALSAFKQQLVALAEGQLYYEYEEIVRTAQKVRKIILLRVNVAPEYADTLGKVFVSIMDITERKQAEEALRNSEARFRDLFENSPISLCEEDFSEVKHCLDALRIEGVEDIRAYLKSRPNIVAECAALVQIVDVNQATLELYHAGSKEELLDNLSVLFRHESYDQFLEELIYIWKRKTHFSWEGVNQTLNGKRLDVNVSWAVVPGYENDLSKVIVSVLDITERKQAEDEHKTHIHFLESLERIDQAIRQETDLEQMLQHAVQTMFSIFGCDRAWLFYPCDPEASSFRVPVEICRPEYPGASALNLDMPMDPSIAKDLRDALASEDPLSYTNGTEKPVNTLTAQQFGVQAQMILAIYPKIGKPWVIGIHQCSHPRNWTDAETALFKEIGRRVADGLSNVLFLRDLRESEERYRTLAEAAQDMIFIINHQGRVAYVNAFAAHLFHSKPEELVGRPFSDLFDHKTVEIQRKNLDKVFETAEPIYDELDTHTLDRTIWLSTYLVPLKDETGQVESVMGVARNITERKRAEEEIRLLNTELEQRVEARTRELGEAQEKLIRQEKLAVLGQLAGGVGHELRNPLGVITNAVYFLRMIQADAGDEVKEYLGIIQTEAHIADKIITDLLDFSRIKSVDCEPVAVAELVRHVLERFPVPENVTVTLKLPEKLPAVYIDPLQMIQVLGNLTLNACQAMPDGGGLTISVARQEGEIAIAVNDTGVGISPENMRKLFEPLFTTKAKGIGLGLAVSKKLAEANRGRIEVTSEVGKGSTFTLYIPVKDQINASPV